MSDTTCLARLLSSAVHDLRNVLAVVRESSGLTADLLRLQEDVPKRDRMLSALSEVQAQVARGALLASAMDLLAECGAAGKAGSGDAGKDGAGPEGAGQDETGEEGCELNLVCQMFCCMAQRLARASVMRLEHVAKDDVDSAASVPAVLAALLRVLDTAAEAGGRVTLKLSAAVRHKQEGVVVEIAEGDNAEAVAAALDPLLVRISGGLQKLMLWRKQGTLFFLPLTGEHGS